LDTMQGMSVFDPAKLKEWRNRRGMTQQEIAVAIGLRTDQHTQISRYERGERIPRGSRIFRLAEVLEIPDTELMTTEIFLPAEEAITAKGTEYLRQLPDHLRLREIAKLAELVEQERQRHRIE